MKQSDSLPGYILVLTLLIISVSVLLVTHIISKTITFTHFAHLVTNREQAKLLAESGIAIACAELNVISTGTGQNKISTQLTAQLPYLNTWQTFTLKQEVDGIDGVCQIYITCEDGKIDINSLYNYQKKDWQRDETKPPSNPPAANKVGYDGKKIMILLGDKLKKAFGEKNPVDILDQIFKNRKEPLEDLSAILSGKDMAKKKILLYAEPSLGGEEKQPIALSDVFTIFTRKKNIQPLMLSPGIIQILGLKSPLRTKDALSFIKKIKPIMKWETSWNDTISSWYGVEYGSIAPEMSELFSSKIEGKTFSVISYGTIGTFTQKLCVIIQQEESSPGQRQPRYVIKRWYWL